MKAARPTLITATPHFEEKPDNHPTFAKSNAAKLNKATGYNYSCFQWVQEAKSPHTAKPQETYKALDITGACSKPVPQ
eukprot:3389262-Amphidinium_carterae.1